jgi:stage II sporulation protein AA (anti-sigma F factor antagonist)
MIDSKFVGKTLYVGLNGELDEHSALFVRNKLDELIDSADVRKLIIELSGLNFMDSTGIGVLLGRYKKLSNLGIPILIANPNKSVDKILTLSGIYKIMPKIATEA